MTSYGKVKVNTITFDNSGTATDVPVSTIAVDSDLALKADLSSPTFTGTINGGNLVLSGDLTVNGTTTSIDSTNLEVEDRNIQIGKVSTPSNTTADGGGITLLGGSDGDKTISWINSTNSWTFSENISLASGKTFSGSGANLTNIPAANLTGTLPAISGTNLTNLPAANLTGTLPAISGANLTNLPPAGNTFTAVANGAIANNKAVKIRTDGKAEQIQSTFTAKTSNYSSTTVTQQNDGSANGAQTRHHSTVWDDTNDRFYTLQGHGSGGFAWLHTWTVNSSTGAVSYGGNLSLGNHATGNNDDQRMDIAWSTQDEMLLEVYRTNGTNYIYYRVFDPGSYSGSTLQWSHGSEYEVHAGGSNSIRLMYDSTTNKFVMSFRDNADTFKMAIYVGTLNTSNKTVTWGSKITVDSRTYNTTRSGICSMGNGLFCLAYSHNQGEVYAKIGQISSSANSATFGSEGEITNTSLQGEHPEVEYDFSQNKLVFVYRDPNNGYVKAQSATHSGTAFQYISLVPATLDSNNVHHLYRPVYNSLTGGIYVLIVREENGGAPRLNHVSVSGTHASASGLGTIGGNDVEAIHDIAFNNNQGEVFYVGCNSSTNDMNAVRILVTTESSNLTDASQYVGFADAAYTNGQTATIKTYGNIVDTLSGLTAGTLYYLQEDGTVGTSSGFSSFATNTPLAGTALSATKLLIRDPLAKT